MHVLTSAYVTFQPTRQIYIARYRVADKSLARPGRKQATAREDFDVHKSYLLS